MKLKLDVAISTYRPQGLQRVADMNLPEVEGVRYVVSWQEHDGAPIPEQLLRRDVKIVRFGRSGQSANRNNSLAYTSAPIVLISDDDLKYTANQLKSVIDTLQANPQVQVATFQYLGDNKQYPHTEQPITRHIPKGLTFTTFEIAVRRECLSSLKFDERFGIGGTLFDIGEDEKFMLDAVRMGYICRFFPINITTHPGPTTGLRPITNPRAAAGTGCLIRGWYPWSWVLRIPLKAYRLKKNGSNLGFCLRHMLRGAMIDCSIVR